MHLPPSATADKLAHPVMHENAVKGLRPNVEGPLVIVLAGVILWLAGKISESQ